MSDSKILEDEKKIGGDSTTNQIMKLFPSISSTICICVTIIVMLFVNNYPSEDILEPILGSLFMPCLICVFLIAFLLSVFVTVYKSLFEKIMTELKKQEDAHPAAAFVTSILKPLLSVLQKSQILACVAALSATLLLFSNTIAMFRASARNSLILSSIPLLFCLCTSSCIRSIGKEQTGSPPTAPPPGKQPQFGTSPNRFPPKSGSPNRFPPKSGSPNRFPPKSGSPNRFPPKSGSPNRFPSKSGSPNRFPSKSGPPPGKPNRFPFGSGSLPGKSNKFPFGSKNRGRM